MVCNLFNTSIFFKITDMKKMLFLFLLLPVICFAQKDKYTEASTLLAGDTSLGKVVKMPDLRNWDLYNHFEIGMKSKYIYTVNNDSLYKNIFATCSKDSLPVINFNQQELLVRVYCPQCVVTCSHTGTDNEPCHRNACMYREVWYLRNKKKS